MRVNRTSFIRVMASLTVSDPSRALTTVRGVKILAVLISRSRRIFSSNSPSREPSEPCRVPSFNSAASSSRLMDEEWPPWANMSVRRADTHTNGYSSFTIQLMICAEGKASCFQNVAPSVLGMISDKYNMARVSKTAISVSQRAPNTFDAWAPTPAAPIVWAKVLRIRILEMDLSRLSLTSFSTRPRRGLGSSWLSMNAGVTDSSTASRTEHKKETPIAIARYIRSKVMVLSDHARIWIYTIIGCVYRG